MLLCNEHADREHSFINDLIELYEAWDKPEKAEQWQAKLQREQATEE